MIVTIHQPAYLPWLAYFDKISRSDVFVFLDTVQLEKNSYSYTYRNKIKSPQGSMWLTVPLKAKGHMNNTIREIPIDYSQRWKKKHLKSIFFNYNKSPYFNELYPKLESLYQTSYEFFSELAYMHLLFWLEELQIKTKVVRASDTPINSRKSALILDLCEHFQATRYISGALGKNYLDESAFQQKSIHIEYQKYQHPLYPQLYGDFLPNLAIVDFWMNTHQTDLISHRDIVKVVREGKFKRLPDCSTASS